MSKSSEVFEKVASEIVEFFDGTVPTPIIRALVYRLEASKLLAKELTDPNGSQRDELKK